MEPVISYQATAYSRIAVSFEERRQLRREAALVLDLPSSSLGKVSLPDPRHGFQPAAVSDEASFRQILALLTAMAVPREFCVTDRSASNAGATFGTRKHS